MSEDEVASGGFDGATTSSVVGGLSARTSTQGNVYFNIDDTIAHAGDYTAQFTISYYDTGSGSFQVQYDDGSSDPYKASGNITLTNSNTWKTATVSTSATVDAAFAGQQHSAADFRLRNGNGQITIHSVVVKLTGFGVPNTAAFPPATSITTPASGATVTGTPTIVGKSEPDATVTVLDGSDTVCTATADDSGAWTCTPSKPLSGGPHSLTAKSTDVTNTASNPSTPVTPTVDDGNSQTPITATVPEVPGEFTLDD